VIFKDAAPAEDLVSSQMDLDVVPTIALGLECGYEERTGDRAGKGFALHHEESGR